MRTQQLVKRCNTKSAIEMVVTSFVCLCISHPVVGICCIHKKLCISCSGHNHLKLYDYYIYICKYIISIIIISQILGVAMDPSLGYNGVKRYNSVVSKELLSDNAVVLFDDAMGRAFFVSHQWVDKFHPET